MFCCVDGRSDYIKICAYDACHTDETMICSNIETFVGICLEDPEIDPFEITGGNHQD